MGIVQLRSLEGPAGSLRRHREIELEGLIAKTRPTARVRPFQYGSAGLTGA
jgi:hypothetical protein